MNKRLLKKVGHWGVVGLVAGVGLNLVAPMVGVLYTIPLINVTLGHVIVLGGGAYLGHLVADKLKLR